MPIPIEWRVIRKLRAGLRALTEGRNTGYVLNTSMSKMYLMCDPIVCTTCNKIYNNHIKHNQLMLTPLDIILEFTVPWATNPLNHSIIKILQIYIEVTQSNFRIIIDFLIVYQNIILFTIFHKIVIMQNLN